MNVEGLIQKLERLATKHTENIKAIGEVLVALEDAGEPVQLHISNVLNRRGITTATAIVAMRWAKGEFGNDDDMAEALVGKVKHSVLSKIPTKTITEMVSVPHRVIDPNEGRVIEGTILELPRRAVNRSVDEKGFKPIEQKIKRVPEFRSCVASSCKFDEQTERIVFISKGAETIFMQVPAKVLRRAMELISDDVEA